MENQNQNRSNQAGDASGSTNSGGNGNTNANANATGNPNAGGATNTNPNTGTSGSATGSSSAGTSTTGADDMLTLMSQSPKTCGLGQWMKCLRKPALSMQYTLSKKHIPDAESDPTGQTPPQGANSDTMSVSGGFTIRYFDFAAGVLTLMIVGCLMKGCCCVRKMM